MEGVFGYENGGLRAYGEGLIFYPDDPLTGEDIEAAFGIVSMVRAFLSFVHGVYKERKGFRSADLLIDENPEGSHPVTHRTRKRVPQWDHQFFLHSALIPFPVWSPSPLSMDLSGKSKRMRTFYDHPDKISLPWVRGRIS